jgi:hypothetical protein
VKLYLLGKDDFKMLIMLAVSRFSASSMGLLKYLLLSGRIIVHDGLISSEPIPWITWVVLSVIGEYNVD